MSRDRAPGFSETMWFKKGETDAELAAAAAEAAARGVVADLDRADSLPIEDRYHDDGSLTGGDVARYGLRTGSTQQVPSLAAGPARKSISERALIAELDRARVVRLVLACALVVATALTATAVWR